MFFRVTEFKYVEIDSIVIGSDNTLTINDDITVSISTDITRTDLANRIQQCMKVGYKVISKEMLETHFFNDI